MITIAVVWLCLITRVAYGAVITVNTSGSNASECCRGNCLCSSLSSALHYMQNDTVINITSEVVSLKDIVGMGSGNVSNITIIGNGATIMCNNTGGVLCESCNDITIMGITWYQCGRNDSENPPIQIPALQFNIVANLVIQQCKFLSSLGCPVYLDYAEGNIMIIESLFVHNIFNAIQSNLLCGGLYIVSEKGDANISIISSGFNDNGCIMSNASHPCYFYGVIMLVQNDHDKVNFYIEHTELSNNSNGLYLDSGYSITNSTVIQMSNVTVYNNSAYGIIIGASSGSDNTNTFVYINMEFINFMNNVNALSIIALNHVNMITISISNSIINDNIANDAGTFLPEAKKLGVIRITLMSSASVTIANCHFYNNFNGAVGIYVASPSVCGVGASILFTNVTIYNTTTTNDLIYAGMAIVSIITVNSFHVNTKFTNVNFTSNKYSRCNGEVLLIENSGDCDSFPLLYTNLTDCTFYNNSAFDHVVFLNIIENSNNEHSTEDGDYRIQLHKCTFDNNFGGESILYVHEPTNLANISSVVILMIDNSTFSNNKGKALYLLITEIQLMRTILFINNTANNGAAIYFEEVHSISPDIIFNADVYFIKNSAEQKGGALYFNLVTNHCNVFTSPFDASFINNSANIAGNSIYFSVPHTCQIITNTSDESSLLYVPNKFNYSQSSQTKFSPIVTSPYNIKLYPPAIAVHNSSNDYMIHQYKMLGEPIQFNSSVFDYFDNITESVIFTIDCKSCGDDYVLSTYQIAVHNHTLNELKVFPIAYKDVTSNVNISVTLISVLPPVYRSMNASLSIQLSSCHTGYIFDKSQRQCICYPYSDIVHCTEDHSEIKIGYWIGFLKEYYTWSICPSNYCNFFKRTKTSLGYYNLPRTPDGQCSSHRTGVACGECKPGYTLAYDSSDCINTDKCSAGVTVLVIVLTIVYWIAIVAVVFGFMYFLQFQVSLGYAYGIIYYYSIVDILLGNNVSEEVTYVVSILSSFAKLTPQLFGQLCLVEGLSGIDQQFIHYSHALAVSLILLIIVLVTRHSPRLAMFVSRCIIHVICLLLLLSYTSLASTSLQLLRPLTFNDVDEVRTYSSPDIKYLTGRHLAYAIVAIFCEVIVVIGLPLLLLLEPLLSRKINFVKIKPLLDQFQGCYKNKYRWFAAYYLICREVIVLIVYVGNGDYYNMIYGLQTACVIIAMIHGWVHPYKNNLLNGLDEIILSILVLVVNLNFSFFSFISTNVSLVLVVLPLLLVCFIAIRKLLIHFCARKRRVLNLYNPVEACDESEENDNYNNERR